MTILLLNTKRESVIREIEKIIELQVDVILEGKPSMALSLQTSPAASTPLQARTYEFPGNSPEEAWRFGFTFQLDDMISTNHWSSGDSTTAYHDTLCSCP